MERQILHVDVNNAFLSWSAIERLKNGETLDIRTIPAVIGGDEQKRSGIVLAKSMKAKAVGIVTGETLYMARKKCPNLKVYPGDYKTYYMYSDKLYNLLLEYTDKIERYSIDECFLDMTGYLMNDTLEHKALEIKTRIKKELGFTVNVGIANNKLLAKMASDFEKPDKIHTLYTNEIKTKMWNLPVKELFMLGKKSVPKLYNMGIRTIGDLANRNLIDLVKAFGKHGKLMWEYANGIDNSEVQYKMEKPKSIGNSITLPKDLVKISQIQEVLLSLTEQVTYRLRKNNLLAKTVNIQLRTKDFEDFSHQGKLLIATSNTKDIFEKAKELLEQMYNDNILVRLVGLRVDNLISKDEELQLSIFNDNKNEKQEKLDDTIDKLKNKYGYAKITRAGNLNMDKVIKLKEIK